MTHSDTSCAYMPKAIICDLGNVLFFFDRMKTYREMSKFCRRPVDEVKQILESTDLRDRYELGQLTDAEFFETILDMFETTDKELPFDEFCEIWGNIFEPNYSLFEALALLRSQAMLLTLSNTNHLHYLKIRKTYGNIMSFFFGDRKILSFIEGVAKPDERIFHIARERAGVDFSDCLYIDDITAYVDIARSMGMNGVVYDSYNSFKTSLAALGFTLP